LSRNWYVYAVPFVFSAALAVFFMLYTSELSYDYCDDDFCYVCVTVEMVRDGFGAEMPDVDEGSMCPDSKPYPVRFDRP